MHTTSNLAYGIIINILYSTTSSVAFIKNLKMLLERGECVIFDFYGVKITKIRIMCAKEFEITVRH